jgi:hypothetical protein
MLDLTPSEALALIFGVRLLPLHITVFALEEVRDETNGAA